MAYSLITNASAVGANGGTTSGINTTGASLLVVAVTSYLTTPTTGNLSDSKGNTWTKLTTYTNGGGDYRVTLFYSTNPTVGSGHTVTLSVTSSYSFIGFAAFGGANTTSPFDQQNGASGTSPGSITPSEDNCLVVTACATDGNPNAINSSFTITNNSAFSGGVNIGGGLAYKIQTTAAAVSPTWTTGGGTNSSAIASFKAAAGASGGNQWFLLLGVGI